MDEELCLRWDNHMYALKKSLKNLLFKVNVILKSIFFIINLSVFISVSVYFIPCK